MKPLQISYNGNIYLKVQEFADNVSECKDCVFGEETINGTKCQRPDHEDFKELFHYDERIILSHDKYANM